MVIRIPNMLGGLFSFSPAFGAEISGNTEAYVKYQRALHGIEMLFGNYPQYIVYNAASKHLPFLIPDSLVSVQSESEISAVVLLVIFCLQLCPKWLHILLREAQ
jgi:hypothetical protein